MVLAHDLVRAVVQLIHQADQVGDIAVLVGVGLVADDDGDVVALA